VRKLLFKVCLWRLSSEACGRKTWAKKVTRAWKSRKRKSDELNVEVTPVHSVSCDACYILTCQLIDRYSSEK